MPKRAGHVQGHDAKTFAHLGIYARMCVCVESFFACLECIDHWK